MQRKSDHHLYTARFESGRITSSSSRNILGAHTSTSEWKMSLLKYGFTEMNGDEDAFLTPTAIVFATTVLERIINPL